MPITKDKVGRYVLNQIEEETLLYLDVRKGNHTPFVLTYQGHKEQEVNDQLETIDVVSVLRIEEVDELIKTLMDCSIEMERLKNEN